MCPEDKPRRFLRDNVEEEIKDRVELLLDRIIRLQEEGDFTVGHVVETSQIQLDMGRKTIVLVESILDNLRSKNPNLEDSIAKLVQVADTIQDSYNELQTCLCTLMRNRLGEIGLEADIQFEDTLQNS